MATIFNEMEGSGGAAREPYARIEDWLKTLSRSDVDRALREAEAIFRRQGITFAVYGDDAGLRAPDPLRHHPAHLRAPPNGAGSPPASSSACARSTPSSTTSTTARRSSAPAASRMSSSSRTRPSCRRWWASMPARGIYAHIIGIDIVRVAENEFYVLEDNCRTPSGVSYMLEDREAMMHLFPELFAQQRVAPVENYPAMLRQTLESVAPAGLRRRAHRGGPDARHPQLRLLRARLPGRRDGRRTVRGRRPLRRGRLSLHAHHAGAEAGRRGLPPHRRRLSRPPHLPARFGASAFPASSTSTAPAASRSSMRRAPALPTTSRSTPTCPRSSSSTPARSRS